VESEPLIQFRLDRRSGVPAYRQVVDQVRQAVQLGTLRPGDQLPTVRDVVKQIAINPNTAHRAYRELEARGVTESRHGIGTFIAPGVPDVPEHQDELEQQLRRWMEQARAAGLSDEAIAALVSKTLQTAPVEVS
jgi:GntR family transcriptional regulator